MLTLKACSSGWTPAHDGYNGLANFRVSQPVFGINELRSDEMPYFGAKHPCWALIVQPEFATRFPASGNARLLAGASRWRLFPDSRFGRDRE